MQNASNLSVIPYVILFLPENCLGECFLSPSSPFTHRLEPSWGRWAAPHLPHSPSLHHTSCCLQRMSLLPSAEEPCRHSEDKGQPHEPSIQKTGSDSYLQLKKIALTKEGVEVSKYFREKRALLMFSIKPAKCQKRHKTTFFLVKFPSHVYSKESLARFLI